MPLRHTSAISCTTGSVLAAEAIRGGDTHGWTVAASTGAPVLAGGTGCLAEGGTIVDWGEDLANEPTPTTGLPSSLLGRAILLLDVLAEHGSCTTTELLQLTDVPRPTLYRLLSTLEKEHLTVRDPSGRHRVGLRVLAWSASLQTPSAIVEVVRPILLDVRARTGESVQLYVREGDARVCVASVEPSTGLRVTVPTGSVLPLNLGSGGKAFLPWAADGAQFGISPDELAAIRSRRWAESVAEREVGVASVSSPILDDEQRVRAVLAVSGPADRFGSHPGRKFGKIAADAADQAARLLRDAGLISEAPRGEDSARSVRAAPIPGDAAKWR